MKRGPHEASVPHGHTNALECILDGALAFELWLHHVILRCSGFLPNGAFGGTACCLVSIP